MSGESLLKMLQELSPADRRLMVVVDYIITSDTGSDVDAEMEPNDLSVYGNEIHLEAGVFRPERTQP